MAIDFFCPAKVYGAEKIALKNPLISAEFDRILKHMESNWVLCMGGSLGSIPSQSGLTKLVVLQALCLQVLMRVFWRLQNVSR